MKKNKDTWTYDNNLRKEHHLTCPEACLLGIIEQTQCRYKGCCYLRNRFFIDKLGVKEQWICTTLKKLENQIVIWRYPWFKNIRTRNGYERHIVVSKSVSKYRKFLVKTHNHYLLNKFNKEFGDKNEAKENLDRTPSNNPRKITCKII